MALHRVVAIRLGPAGAGHEWVSRCRLPVAGPASATGALDPQGSARPAGQQCISRGGSPVKPGRGPRGSPEACPEAGSARLESLWPLTLSFGCRVPLLPWARSVTIRPLPGPASYNIDIKLFKVVFRRTFPDENKKGTLPAILKKILLFLAVQSLESWPLTSCRLEPSGKGVVELRLPQSIVALRGGEYRGQGRGGRAVESRSRARFGTARRAARRAASRRVAPSDPVWAAGPRQDRHGTTYVRSLLSDVMGRGKREERHRAARAGCNP